MTDIDDDHGRSRRPDAEDRRWSDRSSTRWPIERSGGTVCGLYCARGDEEHKFLG
jgi:hypothetical protein